MSRELQYCESAMAEIKRLDEFLLCMLGASVADPSFNGHRFRYQVRGQTSINFPLPAA